MKLGRTSPIQLAGLTCITLAVAACSTDTDPGPAFPASMPGVSTSDDPSTPGADGAAAPPGTGGTGAPSPGAPSMPNGTGTSGGTEGPAGPQPTSDAPTPPAASDGGMVSTAAFDDPETKGHDAPGHVSCGDAVADCDMEAGNNCCVSAAMTTDCRQGDCGFGDTTTACDGPEDCGSGEVCCTHVNVPLGVTSACEAPSSVANGSRCQGGSTIGDFELCHTDADCDATSFCDTEGDGTFPWWAFCAARP